MADMNASQAKPPLWKLIVYPLFAILFVLWLTQGWEDAPTPVPQAPTGLGVTQTK